MLMMTINYNLKRFKLITNCQNRCLVSHRSKSNRKKMNNQFYINLSKIISSIKMNIQINQIHVPIIMHNMKNKHDIQILKLLFNNVHL